MKKAIYKSILIFIPFFIFSCSTTKDLEKMNNEKDVAEVTEGAESQEELEQLNEEEMRNILVAEELKQVDVEQTIVYIDRPVYVPEEKNDPSLQRGNKTGVDAVLESQKRATVKPEQYKLGTFFYQYSENLVYEIYAQPFHLTDIVLEKGEIVTATPLFSECSAQSELGLFYKS